MIKEIEQIKSITLKDLEFDIVWKWGGDMKFLGKIEFRSLSGAEKIRLFEKIELHKLFPELEDVMKIDEIWRNFFNIYVSVKNNQYSGSNGIEN